MTTTSSKTGVAVRTLDGRLINSTDMAPLDVVQGRLEKALPDPAAVLAFAGSGTQSGVTFVRVAAIASVEIFEVR